MWVVFLIFCTPGGCSISDYLFLFFLFSFFFFPFCTSYPSFSRAHSRTCDTNFRVSTTHQPPQVRYSSKAVPVVAQSFGLRNFCQSRICLFYCNESKKEKLILPLLCAKKVRQYMFQAFCVIFLLLAQFFPVVGYEARIFLLIFSP